jgi:hypothetical protein
MVPTPVPPQLWKHGELPSQRRVGVGQRAGMSPEQIGAAKEPDGRLSQVEDVAEVPVT